jgi:GxxExxY protein
MMPRIGANGPTRDNAFPLAELSRAVIGAFSDVYNELGYGFAESLYASALEIVLRERGFLVTREVVFEACFHGQRIGMFRADMVVEDSVILELKAGAALLPSAKAQLINYLRLSRLQVGLLLFFGPIPDFKRVVASRPRNDVP